MSSTPRRRATGLLAAVVALAAFAGGALADDAPRTSATQAFTITPGRPTTNDEDDASAQRSLRVPVTVPGKVAVDATWESGAPLELRLTKWTSLVCREKGAGRAHCECDVTADDISKSTNGLFVVTARVVDPVGSARASGSMTLSYPVPKSVTVERAFRLENGESRTVFHVKRPGPMTVDVTPSGEGALKLQLLGPYKQRLGRTTKEASGTGALHVEHVVTRDDSGDNDTWTVVLSGTSGSGTLRVTHAAPQKE